MYIVSRFFLPFVPMKRQGQWKHQGQWRLSIRRSRALALWLQLQAKCRTTTSFLSTCHFFGYVRYYFIIAIITIAMIVVAVTLAIDPRWYVVQTMCHYTSLHYIDSAGPLGPLGPLAGLLLFGAMVLKARRRGRILRETPSPGVTSSCHHAHLDGLTCTKCTILTISYYTYTTLNRKFEFCVFLGHFKQNVSVLFRSLPTVGAVKAPPTPAETPVEVSNDQCSTFQTHRRKLNDRLEWFDEIQTSNNCNNPTPSNSLLSVGTKFWSQVMKPKAKPPPPPRYESDHTTTALIEIRWDTLWDTDTMQNDAEWCRVSSFLSWHVIVTCKQVRSRVPWAGTGTWKADQRLGQQLHSRGFASQIHQKSRLLLGQKQIHWMRRNNFVRAILVYVNYVWNMSVCVTSCAPMNDMNAVFGML